MDGGGGELTLILPKIHSNNPGEQDRAGREGPHQELQKQTLLQALSLQTGSFGGRYGGAQSLPTPSPSLLSTLRGSRHPLPSPRPGLGIGWAGVQCRGGNGQWRRGLHPANSPCYPVEFSGSEEVLGPDQGRGQAGVWGCTGLAAAAGDVFLQEEVWPLAGPLLGCVLFPGEGMAGRVRGERQDHFCLEGGEAVCVCCQHPARTAPGPPAGVLPASLPVLLNPQLTCGTGMERASIQPPPLWPFICHGLLLKAWFL